MYILKYHYDSDENNHADDVSMGGSLSDDDLALFLDDTAIPESAATTQTYNFFIELILFCQL